MGPEGPNPRAEALSIEAQLGLGPEGPNPTGRGVEAVPALARGHMGLGPQGPNPRAEALSIEAQLGLGPNPTGRGVGTYWVWFHRAQSKQS